MSLPIRLGYFTLIATFHTEVADGTRITRQRPLFRNLLTSRRLQSQPLRRTAGRLFAL